MAKPKIIEYFIPCTPRWESVLWTKLAGDMEKLFFSLTANMQRMMAVIGIKDSQHTLTELIQSLLTSTMFHFVLTRD